MGTCGETSTFADHFRAVFGEHWWTWPLPTRAVIEVDYAEPVFPVGRQVKLKAEDYEYLGIASDEDEAWATEHHVSGASCSLSRNSCGSSPSGSPERRRSRTDTPPPRLRARGTEVVSID
mmetsp:Transcript_11216/g.29904  ORF Transcript_11216/g.29904 Transcript_11216/m.29904 type:complete len:120 (+) Transcript_11216:34-393(+)